MSNDPPVSVKVALRSGTRWVLLKNDRNEWELPGGRVDAEDDSLQATARRECAEELGVEVEVGALLDAYLFEVVPTKRVTIVCFAAAVVGDTDLILSDEHHAVGSFTRAEVTQLDLPAGYRRMIDLAAQLVEQS